MPLWVWACIYGFVVCQLSGLATTIYLHRSATHRAFSLSPWVALPMRFHLWLFTGIVVREWVAVHRKHHHFTDEPGDPHSPLLEGVWQILAGNPIYYRRAANDGEIVRAYAKDIPVRRYDRWLLDHGNLGITLGLLLSVAAMRLAGGSWLAAAVAGAAAYLGQGFVYIVANALVNGACHAFGYRNFDNTATNLRWVAWLSAGEGLHNNHHQYPSAGKLSIARHETDPAWPVIRLLAKLRLVQLKPLPRAFLADQSRLCEQPVNSNC